MSLLGLIRYPVGLVFHAPSIYKGSYQCSPQKLKTREEHIEEMKNTKYDIVIVGGGASGAGLAVECSTRGLKACVLEGSDFAAGTSSKSTKLIHGGIRYLEAAIKNRDPAQLKLVFEGLRERSHMRIAGGNMLTKPVGMFIPQKNILDAIVTATGVKMYQALAKIATPGGFVHIPDSKIMGSSMATHLVQCAKRWRRSLLFFDGAHVDQRTVLHLINTATLPDYTKGSVPANAANYCPVTNLTRDASGDIQAATVVDTISGQTFDVKGKVFVNCAGPFSDGVRQLCGKSDNFIQSSSGIHLMFPKRILNEHGGNSGILIPKTTRGSVCFILPYQDYVIAGTTDVKETPTLTPNCTGEEVKYLCEEISNSIGVTPEELERSVVSCWKGFRPLVVPPSKDGSGNVSKVVRSHLINKEGPNFYSLMGGKWTSYREMGEDCLNVILDQRTGLFGMKKSSPNAYKGVYAQELKSKALPSQSYGLKWAPAVQTDNLLSAHFSTINEKDEAIGAFAGLLGRQFDIEQTTAQRMMRSYGYFAWDLLFQGEIDKTNKPLHNVPFDGKILTSEVEWLCEREQGRHVDDVISRRLGLSYLDARAATACIPEVALIMKRKLGWSSSKMHQEIKDCAREVKTMAYHPIEALEALAK